MQGDMARGDGLKAQLCTSSAGHASFRAVGVPPLTRDDRFQGLLELAMSKSARLSHSPGTAILSSHRSVEAVANHCYCEALLGG